MMTDFSQRILGGGAAVSGETSREGLRAASGTASAHVAVLASLLDQIGFAAPEGAAGAHPFREALSGGAAEDLRGALSRLRASDRARLATHLPEAALQELLSISQESDPELFAESLYQWARRQEAEDRLDAAGLVYGTFAQREAGGDYLLAGAGEGLRTRAAQSLDAILGRGAAGPRAEFLLRRLAREASNPVMIAGMATGSFVFSTARTAILSRLLAAPTRSVLGARALASTGAFLLEVPAFWATTKGLNEAIAPGSQRWDMATNARELAGLGLTLGALKLSGLASGALSRRLARSPNPLEWSAGERLGHGLLQQGGMLAGIMAGHRLEEAVGLRPHLDGATALIDSLGMLLQFHVGGRLSQTALGPGFQAYSRELETRSRRLEGMALAELAGRLRGGLGGSGPSTGFGAPVYAMAMSGAGGGRGPSGPRPGELPPGVMAMMGGEGSKVSNPVNPARERGIRIDVPPALPERTGRTQDDLFAPPLGADEILQAVRELPIHLEITSRLESRTGEWARTSDADLGNAVGEALEARLGEIARHPTYESLRALAERPLLETDFSRVPRYETLPEELREALDSAADLMQITQYALRSNQLEMLDAAREQLRPESQTVYQELLTVIRLLKGPRLAMPAGDIARGDEVIGPDSAVLSHGAGAMSSWLRVISRRVVPGGLPWYARLLATEANYSAVKSLRTTGKNPFMSPAMSHNFEGDVPIEPVYFNAQDLANSDAVARTLYRTVRVQMLNVPAKALPEILTESFVRQLPERAILISAIGGVVEPKDEAPQFPSDFVRERLDRHGRGDVEIVSLSGYVPADKLWSGERVSISLSAREDEANPGAPREAARLVARLLAGDTMSNDYVTATLSHWERSSNVGKVLKNVFTLEAGWRAGRIAREVVEAQQGLASDSPRYRELQDLGRGRYAEAREHIKDMMRSVLLNNEGVKPRVADYKPEVWMDFDECATIYFDNLVELFRRARRMSIREASADDIHNLLKTEVFEAPRDRRVATTRNPRYGIARALHEMLVEHGLPFRDYSEVGPNVTVEGLNSLDPILRLYHNPRRDIEQRRLPDAVYELHERVFGKRVERPPEIREYLRWAVDRQPRTAEARGMQAVLRDTGINPVRLRQALEGSDERTLAFLGRELRRLSVYHARVQHARRAIRTGAAENTEEMSGEMREREALLQRQVEFVRQLKEAALRGQFVSALRIPRPIGPYENAFEIVRRDAEGERPTHQVFVRLNLDEALKRLTQLGMLLRRFPPENPVEIDIRIPESARTPENIHKLFELELTGREIVRAFQSQRPGSIRLSIDRRSTESEASLRHEPPSDAFYQSLEPLARWVLKRASGEAVRREEVRALLRSPRHETNGVTDRLLSEGNGWVMLLTPSEGPIQSGIRTMLTRPEKSTLMGIYSGDRLVDTFAVYRYDAGEARILSHRLLTDFRRSLADSWGYQNLSSVDFFQGLPVEEFIRDYQEYARRENISVTEVRPIPLRSTPVEEALIGRNPQINPAILKVYLMLSGERGEALIRASDPLYELPPEEARSRFAALAEPALREFFPEDAPALHNNPLYLLYQKFGFQPGVSPLRSRPE
ncbi:hypothetical protein FBR05_11350 [Deltaproteobacteria bacterium PRO3]|nr:hypothetical protein [Deltaproteobacteria bacterium PRO3]